MKENTILIVEDEQIIAETLKMYLVEEGFHVEITGNGNEDEILAQKKGVSLKYSFDQYIPHLKIDQHRISQVMHNLLSNAIYHTPEGGRITVEVKNNFKSGILVSVEDTGTGIPKEQLERIFDRFYRVDQSRSRNLGGTGLGLAIVRELIQLHGGKVWAESELGKGSKFSFLLSP